MRKAISMLVCCAVAALALAGCGGNGGNLSDTSGSTVMISGGDAPLTSVLAALVTVSSVSFTDSNGTSTGNLLNHTRTIELSQLGGIRAPLDTHKLTADTYTSVTVVVSAATITYINSSGNVTTTNATINGGSSIISLSPNLVVGSTDNVDLRFDFDLADSLDLTSGTVTFTPDISAVVAKAAGESAGNRVLYFNGVVTAVSTANNTLTVEAPDTQLSLTENVNSGTVFDSGLTLASIQAGAAVRTVIQLNGDGTVTALSIDIAGGGTATGSNTRVDNGVVTGTLSTNGVLSQFTIFVRGSSGPMSMIGQMVTVNVNGNTTYKDTSTAVNSGLATFDATQVVAGAGVWVTGSTGGTAIATTLTGTQVQPSAVDPHGLSVSTPTAITGGFSIPMLLDANGNFSKYSSVISVNIDTNANTNFSGHGLSASNVGSLSGGIPLTCDCFVGFNTTSSTYTLFARGLEQNSH